MPDACSLVRQNRRRTRSHEHPQAWPDRLDDVCDRAGRTEVGVGAPGLDPVLPVELSAKLAGPHVPTPRR